MGSIILDIVYGYQTKLKDDEWVALADIVVNDIADTFTYKFYKFCVSRNSFHLL